MTIRHSRILPWFQIISVTVAFFVFANCHGADWVRAGMTTNQPIWGLHGRLQFALHPGGFTRGEGGPRGLIRIGYPTLPDGRYDLINFIAIEPIVGKERGFSELEKSGKDGNQGKLILCGEGAALDPGTITSPKPGVEMLSVHVRVEKFHNGAHVHLLLSQRSDAPDELTLEILEQPDSAQMQSCILTATMGNKARTRELWLKNGPVSAAKSFGKYRGPDFTPHASFPLARLPRNAQGDAIVAFTNNEEHPQDATELPNHWKYLGEKVTQYWRKPSAGINDTLRCVVNARYMYWKSQNPLPGGLAFENVEFEQKFHDKQRFIFGITKRTPAELLK